MIISEKQKVFIKNMNHRYCLKVGARRCGKTYLDNLYTIPKRILERKGKDGLNLILGVSNGTIERNVLQPLRQLYGRDLVSTINSNNIAKLFGEEVYCLGAEKVIIGSAAWNPSPDENGSVLNVEFLEELNKVIGKQRVIISVDAINGKIAVKGWTETVNIPLIEGAKQAEKYCSELLFTCVEKEGCMEGTDVETCKALRDSVECRVVVAGGVNSVEQIVELEKIGCDVQLGMALYTGVVNLKDAFIGCLDFEKTGGMIPVIAQSPSGEVLMMGYSNKEAFEKTFETITSTDTYEDVAREQIFEYYHQ